MPTPEIAAPMSTFYDLFSTPVGCLAAWALAIGLVSHLLHRWYEFGLGPVRKHEAHDRRFRRAAVLAAFSVVAALISTSFTGIRVWRR